MFGLLGDLGVHCWFDMLQALLTLDAMRRGVEASDVFLLILTESVLGRWFCQQEILHAIDLGKPILLLMEQDERFKPFPLVAWRRGDASVRDFPCDSASNRARICAAIDAALPFAVPHRRRDFEAAAMLQALCGQMGISLHATVNNSAMSTSIDIKVAVITARAVSSGQSFRRRLVS